LGNFQFPPVTGSSLINPGQSACLLNPSYSGSFYCRQYYGNNGPSLGVEPVFPYWFPTMGNETEQSAPPQSAEPPEQDPLAAQVGNLTAEVEMMRQEQAMRDTRSAPPQQAPPAAEK